MSNFCYMKHPNVLCFLVCVCVCVSVFLCLDGCPTVHVCVCLFAGLSVCLCTLVLILSFLLLDFLLNCGLAILCKLDIVHEALSVHPSLNA